MLVLPKVVAAQPPAPSLSRAPSIVPSPLLGSPAPLNCSWYRRNRSPRGPLATAADGRRGGSPLPGPEERDPLLVAALCAAHLRDQESRRPDPLFIDPYAAVLLSHDEARQDMGYLVPHAVPCPDHYRLATRYIDDKLQNLINSSDDMRQIVLLTDGMDTRPYRLTWPRLSVVHDVSPGMVFNTATQQLRGTGAKVSRNCVLLHTPAESPDLQEGLCKNGFNGNRLSLWVLQTSVAAELLFVTISLLKCFKDCSITFTSLSVLGLPLCTLASLGDLLLVISNLAMKGSVIIGELPRFSDWTAPMGMGSEQDMLEKLFFTQGFRVSFVPYENIAIDIGLDLAPMRDKRGGLLFVAEQLRFSDAQMDSFRMHFERMEKDADEEGFEEL